MHSSSSCYIHQIIFQIQKVRWEDSFIKTRGMCTANRMICAKVLRRRPQTCAFWPGWVVEVCCMSSWLWHHIKGRRRKDQPFGYPWCSKCRSLPAQGWKQHQATPCHLRSGYERFWIRMGHRFWFRMVWWVWVCVSDRFWIRMVRLASQRWKFQQQSFKKGSEMQNAVGDQVIFRLRWSDRVTDPRTLWPRGWKLSFSHDIIYNVRVVKAPELDTPCRESVTWNRRDFAVTLTGDSNARRVSERGSLSKSRHLSVR